MRILIVAATAQEVDPLVARCRDLAVADSIVRKCVYGGHAADILVTGVGMVATAAWCSRALSEARYELALNVGLCGTFDRSIDLGTVVHVTSDRIVELGAEDGERFLPIEELGLGGGSAPAVSGALVNPAPPANGVLSRLPAVTGITVNTVHGSEQSIARVVERFRPQVESMEGAAFMYACMIHNLPFAQVRAVSNLVERRNRTAWRIPEAIERLGAETLRILGAL